MLTDEVCNDFNSGELFCFCIFLSYKAIFASILVSLDDNEMCTELKNRFRTDCSTLKFCTARKKHNGSDELQGKSLTHGASSEAMTTHKYIFKTAATLQPRQADTADTSYETPTGELSIFKTINF
jgi:hypothetical protein